MMFRNTLRSIAGQEGYHYQAAGTVVPDQALSSTVYETDSFRYSDLWRPKRASADEALESC